MGKSKKKNGKKQQEVHGTKTGKVNKSNNRNQSATKRGNRNFRNFYDFSRRSDGYGSYGSYGNYGSYQWHRGNHSSNTRPYRTKSYRKPPSRPASPVLGSEEYMVRKIQKTSAIIMRQLLNPDEQIIDNKSQTSERSKEESSKSTCEQNTKICQKPAEPANSKNRGKRINNYNIEEIQKKILNHITNLNSGRKKNLINSDISGYDAAIQQIQKQKRLEISRALRDMCSKPNETQESSDFINSIIPDMGIKIEDLPCELIEELRKTLNLDLDCGNFDDTGNYPVGGYQTQDENILNSNNFFINEVAISEASPLTCIKAEPVDENMPHLFDDVQKNYIANTSDNIGNQQVWYEVEHENIINTYNNSVNETIKHGASVKLEPKDESHLVTDDRLNFDENKDYDLRSFDTSNSESNTFTPVTMQQEIEKETTPVKISEREVSENINSEKNYSCDYNSFSADKDYQPDNTEGNENNITFKPVAIKQEIESEICHDETSQAEISVNLNSEKNDSCDYNSLFTVDKKGQPEQTLDNTEKIQNEITFRPVNIKQQIESGTSHLQTSQHEVSVNLNSEKNDSHSNDFLFTVDKENQSERTLDNTGRNQNEIAFGPVTIKQKIQNETCHVETSQHEVSTNINSEKNYSLNFFSIPDKVGQSQMNLGNIDTNKNNNEGRLNDAISNNNMSLSVSTFYKTNTATQTEDETAEKSIESFLAKYFKQPPRSISEAIARMLKIDRCILKLTKYRQSLFNNFRQLSRTDSKTDARKRKKIQIRKDINTTPNILPQKRAADTIGTAKKKKIARIIKNKERELNCRSRNSVQKEDEQEESLKCENISDMKSQQDLPKQQEVQGKLLVQSINEVEEETISGVIQNNQQEINCKLTNGVQKENELVETVESDNIPAMPRQQNLLKFQDVHEKMLVLKIVEDKLVAATDSGKIFFCSLVDGHYTKEIQVCNVPITSLLFIKTHQDYLQMFVGSFELNLMQFTIYKFQSHCVEKNVNIDDSVQCMENKWDYIFIGGMRGSLLRYSLNNKRIEYADKFGNNNSILVLRATQEGARRILIIGSRNSSVCIRDAMTGLHLRILDYIGSPTVYSLILDKNLVYSGTTSHDILVFCFHDGKLMHSLKATDSKGISCMKVVKNLLFASCHNGNIYVYNLQDHTFISSIEGPGGVILSMEVLENQVIVGTMSFKFTSVPIPHDILRYKLK